MGILVHLFCRNTEMNSKSCFLVVETQTGPVKKWVLHHLWLSSGTDWWEKPIYGDRFMVDEWGSLCSGLSQLQRSPTQPI